MHHPLARSFALLLACTLGGTWTTLARSAPTVLWVNGLSGEFKRADLSLDKTTVFRQVPQGTTCPWFPLPAGKATFEVSGSGNLNLTGNWEFPDDARVLFITYGNEQAASRTILLPAAPKPGFQAFNAVPDAVIQTKDDAGPAARCGFSLAIPPDGMARLLFPDGAVWSMGMSLPATDSKDSSLFLTLHQAKCDGAHDVMASVVDSISGKSDEWLLIAGSGREPKEISQDGFRVSFTPAPKQSPPPFDPVAIDWTKVKSQIAWFNATPHNQSLTIGGMMVFRQLRAGSLAHFAPWPSGTYECESHTNPGDRIGKASFTLDDAKRVVLISISQTNQKPRIIPIEAAASSPANSSREKPATHVRILNGFPSGELLLPTRFEGAKLGSGAISNPVNLDTSTALMDFPGRLLLTTPAGEHLSLTPKSPDFTTLPGDWVLLVFLSPSNPEAHDYAWVNFTTGTLLAREDLAVKKHEE